MTAPLADLPDLLARLDVIVSCPIYVRADQKEIRDMAARCAAAIRAEGEPARHGRAGDA